MRAAVAVVLLLACTEHGQAPSDSTPPTLPVACEGRCIVDDPGEPTSDICCDSVTCFLDDETNQWRVVFCDPPLDPCTRCVAGEICVQSFDGTCNQTTTCVDEIVGCPDNACTADCEQAYCGAPLQCQNRPPCGTESPTAFTCYGP